MEYLPFSSLDKSKGSFEEIIERYLGFIYNISLKFYSKRCLCTYEAFAFCNESLRNRVLLRSREIKIGKYDNLSDVAEQHRLQSLEKAKVTQWLCFTPPSTITNVKDVSKKLLLQALEHR
jgi:nuclear pore complex protein Nup107